MAVVITESIWVRNYLQTGALERLALDCDIRLLVAEELPEIDVVREHRWFHGTFSARGGHPARHYQIFNILMWRHRSRSTSFAYRARRVMGGDRAHPLARLAFAMRHPSLTLSIRVLGCRALAGAVAAMLIRRLPVNDSLRSCIHAAQPSVVVFPSSAYDPVGNDIARLGQALGVPTIFLIDNWDNLSSKSVLWAPPDHLGVWGPQSEAHAREIQGIPEHRITRLGTPRFDHYFRERWEHVRTGHDQYVIFVGCALPFDEVSALEAIEAEIAGDPARYGTLKVLYRPHPWRQTRARERPFKTGSFHHIRRDETVDDRQGGRSPALEHYAPLLREARFVMGPPTTMAIEALIFGKRLLLLGYDDGVHFSSPHNQLRHYEHFKGLTDIPSVSVCSNRAFLRSAFRSLWDASGVPLAPDACDEYLAHFLEISDQPYAERLRLLVQHVLHEHEAALKSAASLPVPDAR